MRALIDETNEHSMFVCRRTCRCQLRPCLNMENHYHRRAWRGRIAPSASIKLAEDNADVVVTAVVARDRHASGIRRRTRHRRVDESDQALLANPESTW